MSNQFGIPEITPAEVDAKRQAGEDFLLIDVREANELMMANLGPDVIFMPLSELADKRAERTWSDFIAFYEFFETFLNLCGCCYGANYFATGEEFELMQQ